MSINNVKFRSKAKNYIKEFSDFNEGYQELISIVPEVKLYSGSEGDYNTVINNILNTISENIPSPKNPNFPNTISFSINSREIGLLTDDKIAYGWKIFFNRENATHVYQFRVTFLSISMSKKSYITALKEADWKELDFTSNRQSRFWNELDSKFSRRTNKFETNSSGNILSENNERESVENTNTEDVNENIKIEENIQIGEDISIENNNNTTENINTDIVNNNDNTFDTAEANIEENNADNVYSIMPGNIPGTYIISCGEYGAYSINFNENIFPESVEIINKDEKIIKFKGIIYNCSTGKIFRE